MQGLNFLWIRFLKKKKKKSLLNFALEDGDGLEENSNHSKAFIEHLLRAKTACFGLGEGARRPEPGLLSFSCNTDRWCDLQKVILSEPQFPGLENGDDNQGGRMDAKNIMRSQYEPLSLRLLVLIPHDFFGALVLWLSS